MQPARTCDKTGHNKRKYEHLKNAHEHVSRKRHKHDELLCRWERSSYETDYEAKKHSSDRQYEQQVLT